MSLVIDKLLALEREIERGADKADLLGLLRGAYYEYELLTEHELNVRHGMLTRSYVAAFADANERLLSCCERELREARSRVLALDRQNRELKKFLFSNQLTRGSSIYDVQCHAKPRCVIM